jgi:6-pyruvoyltetrahydropterin/6-carboxytetrahydropterin synthase
MVRITRAIEFSASLRYRRGDLSEQENRRRFGHRAQRHGHNYRLEVTVRGEPDPVSGMVLDLKELNDLLEREIMSRFDHRDLTDDTPYFEKQVPSPENLATVIAEILRESLSPGSLDRIRLYQDRDLWVDVTEP